MPIAHDSRRGSRDIERIGSVYDDVELAIFKAAARQRMATGQLEFDFGPDAGASEASQASGGPLAMPSSRMGHLWDALSRTYQVLGFWHGCWW